MQLHVATPASPGQWVNVSRHWVFIGRDARSTNSQNPGIAKCTEANLSDNGPPKSDHFPPSQKSDKCPSIS